MFQIYFGHCICPYSCIKITNKANFFTLTNTTLLMLRVSERFDPLIAALLGNCNFDLPTCFAVGPSRGSYFC